MPNLYTLDNLELAKFGQARVEVFLSKNGLPKPKELNFVENRGMCGLCTFPEDRRNRDDHPVILVQPSGCAKPSRGYGMKWSFPGYVTDRTPVGVVAHEIGHHIDYETGFPSRSMPRSGKVSSYEPNHLEAWAETMRLFILNPDLLRTISPDRYKYVREVVGLRKTTNKSAVKRIADWGASDAIIERCEIKCAK